PANRNDGRLRSPSSPRRNIPGVGGGVFFPRTTRARRGRGPRRRAIDVLTHPAMARLHPTGSHAERQERLSVLLAHQHVWSEGRAATEEELLLCHTAEHVEVVRAVRKRSGSTPTPFARRRRSR